MVLKKQTVWLLTMLSLIVVLSVYYMTAPEGTPGEDVAFISDEEMTEEMVEEMGEVEMEDVTVNMEETLEGVENDMSDGMVSNIASNEVFATIRNEMLVARERMAEDYTNIIASPDASPELKSEALDKSTKLQRVAQQEATLETLIKAKGYEDVLVLAEEEQVRIIVQAAELNSAQANEIMILASEQLGSEKQVAVGYHPAGKE
ncbi:SpoIIIAH-like family protein [Halalkalibacterium ligniniphilum]|uniref:SpoIIIAH-like family protein n=1 Tax=Halalkalibacterium ligniniphilum TaxID=1134413 RepID=UPI00035E6463|nr:SpoIIIAH-like family protein [Halalkalibacterium ligniniphilum]